VCSIEDDMHRPAEGHPAEDVLLKVDRSLRASLRRGVVRLHDLEQALLLFQEQSRKAQLSGALRPLELVAFFRKGLHIGKYDCSDRTILALFDSLAGTGLSGASMAPTEGATQDGTGSSLPHEVLCRFLRSRMDPGVAEREVVTSGTRSLITLVSGSGARLALGKAHWRAGEETPAARRLAALGGPPFSLSGRDVAPRSRICSGDAWFQAMPPPRTLGARRQATVGATTQRPSSASGEAWRPVGEGDTCGGGRRPKERMGERLRTVEQRLRAAGADVDGRTHRQRMRPSTAPLPQPREKKLGEWDQWCENMERHL